MFKKCKHIQRWFNLRVWDGMIIGGRTEFVFPNRFLTARLNSSTPGESVCRRLDVGQYFHLMHENSRLFTAGIVTSCLDNEAISELDSNWSCDHCKHRIIPQMGNIHYAFWFRQLHQSGHVYLKGTRTILFCLWTIDNPMWMSYFTLKILYILGN